ncbi:MAG TPA: SDR family oxidoreductase [Chitinophagaceae bacterium]|jgi:short-subunit dehydrogenase|nr:SDR family oxidoreductase [Chitinophagaceae bacterium]
MATVLILGSTSDMAIAIARKFASEKYDIQLAARNVEQIGPLQSDIKIRYQVSCSVLPFNATEFETHQAFFANLTPKPDVTVCVFGYMGDNEAAVADWNEAQKVIHTNYTGAVSILNVAASYYMTVKKGTIVGISSVAGERGRQSNFMYGSAKAGFTAYLSGLRNRMFRENVHVVTVLPGFVYTRMTENLKLPKPLTAEPSEIGEAVYSASINKKDIIYVRWFWRWIMMIIKMVPEFIFKKLKL